MLFRELTAQETAVVSGATYGDTYNSATTGNPYETVTQTYCVGIDPGGAYIFQDFGYAGEYVRQFYSLVWSAGDIWNGAYPNPYS